MEKRVFIIHGFEGNNKDCWIPWLKENLSALGFKVFALEMPSPNKPKMSDWIKKISESVGKPNKETFFVGHSLGCISVLRYIESIKLKDRVGGFVLVAGFIESLNIPEIDEFTKQKLNTKKVIELSSNRTVIASDNDEDISLKSAVKMSKSLKSKLIIEKGKGHFDDYAKVFQLPSALDSIKEMSK